MPPSVRRYTRRSSSLAAALLVTAVACGRSATEDPTKADAARDIDAPISMIDATPGQPDAAPDAAPDAEVLDCGTPSECAAIWEQHASDRFDAILGDATALAAFLRAVPKGGDLHNHLTGAVYAETYLAWAKADGDCINSTTFSAVYSNQCSASTQPTPTAGTFYDQIVAAWSMQDFVPSAGNTGHDHFSSGDNHTENKDEDSGDDDSVVV